ncbi:hypothetical protein, partial [Methylacidiphilum caldifontis]|uniref:hypothetical protein n=1 Tax=Methylacidiphilum caldifontis TaxID=2795386 RepID=UPI00106BD2C2
MVWFAMVAAFIGVLLIVTARQPDKAAWEHVVENTMLFDDPVATHETQVAGESFFERAVRPVLERFARRSAQSRWLKGLQSAQAETQLDLLLLRADLRDRYSAGDIQVLQMALALSFFVLGLLLTFVGQSVVLGLFAFGLAVLGYYLPVSQL